MGGNKGKYYQGKYEGHYSWDIRMGFKIGRKDCGGGKREGLQDD